MGEHAVEALLNHAADFISTNMDELLQSEHFLEADPVDVAAFFRYTHMKIYNLPPYFKHRIEICFNVRCNNQ